MTRDLAVPGWQLSPELEPRDDWGYDDCVRAGRYVARVVERAEVRRAFYLGGMAARIETKHADHSLAKYAAQIGVEYATLKVWRGIFRAFPESDIGISDLPLGMYQVLASQADRFELIKRAEGWTVAQARELVQSRRPPGQLPAKAPAPAAVRQVPADPGMQAQPAPAAPASPAPAEPAGHAASTPASGQARPAPPGEQAAPPPELAPGGETDPVLDAVCMLATSDVHAADVDWSQFAWEVRAVQRVAADLAVLAGTEDARRGGEYEPGQDY